MNTGASSLKVKRPAAAQWAHTPENNRPVANGHIYRRFALRGTMFYILNIPYSKIMHFCDEVEFLHFIWDFQCVKWIKKEQI